MSKSTKKDEISGISKLSLALGRVSSKPSDLRCSWPSGGKQKNLVNQCNERWRSYYWCNTFQVRENGAVWHPSVLPYGQINCVKCNCKDGVTDCKRKDCPLLTCRDKVQDKEACCPRCAVTGAEVSQISLFKTHN